MSVYQQAISARYVPQIAPGESKPYGLDWTDYLAEIPGDTINGSTWACAGATLSAPSATGATTQTLVTVAPSATVGTVLELINTITTVGGVTAIRTLPIEIADL
jgi:hypothetical protein